MEKQTYQPISCSFYDELEAWATLKKHCVIEYQGEDGNELKVEGKIVDFFIKDKVEYLKLDSTQSIRLDYLIRVNGKALPNAC